MISILRPGLQATIQDLGRPGYGHLGVPRAGAADRPSLGLANRLVGNDESDAAIEFLYGDFAVRFDRPTSLALTGAPVAARLGGRPVAHSSWLYARAGDVLEAGPSLFGLWTYLAVGGGIDARPVLGSRSFDSLSKLGPPPLQAGQTVPAHPSRMPLLVPDCPVGLDRPPAVSEIRFTWGPREDWLTASARRDFVDSPWRLSAQVDRIAARLEGPTLDYASKRQPATEGLHLGSIQVTESGQPIVHLANHPPTGGYPVMGVIVESDVWRVAQSRPGAVVRFVATGRRGAPEPGAPR